MGKIIRNFIYNGTYNMLLILLPIITTPFLTRTLGKDALGVDSYVCSVVALVKLFGALGINMYSNREVAYHRDDKKKLTQTYYEIQKIRWSLGLLVMLGYLLIASRTKYAVYFLIQTFSLVGYFIDVTWLFVGREDMKLPVFRNIVVKIIQTVLIFTLIKSPEDLTLYVWISALGTFLSSVCMYTQVHKYVGKYDASELDVRRHLKPILALFLPQAASSIYVQFDRTMIGWLSEHISYVSIYDRAENLVKMPVHFVAALSAAMTPRVSNEFAKNNLDSIKELLKNELRYVLLFLIPMVIGMEVISDKLVILYLGKQYMESSTVIKILMPMVFAIAMGEVLSTQLLVSVNDTKGMTVAYLCGAACDLILNAILIPHYNAAGAAFGTLVAEITVVIIQYNYAKKYIGKLGILQTIPKKAIAVMVMFLAIYPLGRIYNYIWIMFIQIAVGAIVYFVSLFLLKDKEAKNMMNIFKNKFRRKGTV